MESLATDVFPRSGCALSPSASAFSAILSAFIGSVINGLTSGWLVAFMTGWIAWLAIFRVLLGGLYMLYRSVTNTWGPGRSGILWANMWPRAAVVRGLEQPAVSAAAKLWAKNHPTLASTGPGATALDRSVTALGWFSWGYTALFAPVTQVLFVAANTARHDIGATKIVKGLTVAVTALPLCIDCRVRYGDALGRAWRGRVFNFATSLSALVQGGLCAVLLVEGLLDLKSASRGGFPVIIMAGVYPVFALFWMAASFSFLPMRDGGRKRAGQTHWAGYFLDVGAGAFAGVFLAAPAIALYSSAQFNKRAGLGFGEEPSSGLNDLGEYLSCESQWWRRFAAVSP
ncbi:hypothetical protein B0T25DRAFT_453731 [Lasiosphaeria hispida]|uniref:Uncharacterized protein n=1 Tax=Lasiosphaeria hispida TaxID=260671 RepID=A0AAJ0MDK5_9PEZI|nr:hypothetical protein B0T25DRAFT_453731 [Lasiosphaeria hispida]